MVVDTDTASDDAVALIMALREPAVEVVAITVVAGNVPLAQASRNARYTVELCGAEVPVHEGAERPRHHAVQHRLGNERGHALGRAQQLVQLDHERRFRRVGRRRGVTASEPLGARRRGAREPAHQLPNLLVFEQPPDQLGPRILPVVVVQPARQQHLGLDAQQPGGHFEIVGRLVQAQVVNDGEELIRDLGDRQIGDVQLVFTNEVEQEVERPGELLELDNESRGVAKDRGGHEPGLR
jgi:hypothetical protein